MEKDAAGYPQGHTNPKVSSPVQGCSPSPAVAVEPSAKRQSLNHP